MWPLFSGHSVYVAGVNRERKKEVIKGRLRNQNMWYVTCLPRPPTFRSAIKFSTVGPTLYVVIYSRFHRNPFRGFGTPEGRISGCPITLGSGFHNSLHYRPSRDTKWTWNGSAEILLIIKTKLNSVSLTCKSHSFKTAKIKKSANSKHRS